MCWRVCSSVDTISPTVTPTHLSLTFKSPIHLYYIKRCKVIYASTADDSKFCLFATSSVANDCSLASRVVKWFLPDGGLWSVGCNIASARPRGLFTVGYKYHYSTNSLSGWVNGNSIGWTWLHFGPCLYTPDCIPHVTKVFEGINNEFIVDTAISERWYRQTTLHWVYLCGFYVFNNSPSLNLKLIFLPHEVCSLTPMNSSAHGPNFFRPVFPYHPVTVLWLAPNK